MVSVLEDFEKEFLSEIKNNSIDESVFIDCGVAKQSLNIEKHLENLFGSDIIKHEYSDFQDNGQKKVENVKLSDIEQNDVLKKLYDEIDADESGAFVQMILSKDGE